MKFFNNNLIKPFNNNDLDSYFNKLGMNRSQFEANLQANRFDALSRLYLSHIQTFIFQNFELRKLGVQHHFFRKPLTLDLYRKLLSPNEVGGYCFQLSQLFYEVLKHYGFDVQRHLARVLNTMKVNSPEVLRLPSSHLVLTVMLDGKQYFLDAGLPTRAPRLPLLVAPGEVVQHFDEMQIKIIPGDNPTYVFSRKINGQYMDVVQSDLIPVNDQAVEFAMLQLTYFPGDIGIRDRAFLVSIITANRQ